MEKKGFTLIELLAVIVILAIIALIATPIVMNLIENARKGAAERSAENYLDAVETAIATKRLDNGTIANGEYIVNSEGKLCQIGGDCLEAEVSGESPKNGSTVTIKEGIIEKETTNIIIGNYDIKYDSEAEVFKAIDYNPYALGTKYVFNPGDGNRIFYVLEDGDTTKLTIGRIAQAGEVSLILDRNIDDERMTWCKTATENTCSADGAQEALNSKTSEWNNGRVALPTLQQVLQKNEGQYFITSSVWLYSNLYTDLNNTNPKGYWTSTPDLNTTTNAWFVYYPGNIRANKVTMNTYFGVRPVITISKSQLQ